MSWIYREDVAAMFVWILGAPVRGVLNATAPDPVRNSEFTQALASALKRPAPITVNEFAIRTVFGETASVVLVSQRVFPQAAKSAGFLSRYTDVRAAFTAAV